MRSYALAVVALGLAGALPLAACSDPVGGGLPLPPPTSTTTGDAAVSSWSWDGGDGGLPLPDAGPGSLTSTAHQAFVTKVYPAVSPTCAQCHATGTLGAPTFLQGSADLAYQSLDARGLIVSGSPLLSKGTHAGGAAPALTPAQSAAVTEWLDLEAKERVGQAAPTNILERVGSCMSRGLFDAIKWGAVVTKARTTENANQCTDCDNARCASCHTGGDNGFHMGVASGVEPDDLTFEATKKMPTITRYIGLNGTQPVPSYGIRTKEQVVATGPAYSHPMFTLGTDRVNAINAFVADAITKYNAKLCGQ